MPDQFSGPSAGAAGADPGIAAYSDRICPTLGLGDVTELTKSDKSTGIQFLRYFGPLLDALRGLGGSGTPDEVP